MYSTQAAVRELYERLSAYDRDDCFAGVLSPWLQEHDDERAWLATIAAKDQRAWRPGHEELCRLYAFARVGELLLLRFQPPPAAGEWRGPALSLDEYVTFLTGLGMRTVEHSAFHPFFHEIVLVEPYPDPDAAIGIVHTIWPCSMLGDLLFARGGVLVRAGAHQLVPAIAQSSTLYWAHRRACRPVEDLSLGWGSNSQWRTTFRRDYTRGSTLCFNGDGTCDVREPAPAEDAGLRRDELSVDQRIELLVHRCFVRTALPHHDRWPWDDRLEGAIDKVG